MNISGIISNGMMDDKPPEVVRQITRKLDDAMTAVRIAEMFWEQDGLAAKCRIVLELARVTAIYD